MKQVLAEYIKSCLYCQHDKANPNPRPIDEINPTISLAPIQTAFIDLLHEMRVKIITFTEENSRYTRYYRVEDESSTEAIRVFKLFIQEYGYPMGIRTNLGRNFISSEWESFCRDHHISHRLPIASYAAYSNGEGERPHATIWSILKSILNSRRDRDVTPHLDEAVGAYNERVHSAIGMSPHEAFFGWAARSLLQARVGVPSESVIDTPADRFQRY